MTDRERLAAYAKELGIWDGEHAFGERELFIDRYGWECSHCRHRSYQLPKTRGEIAEAPVCPGPDYTQDTDVLMRMALEVEVEYDFIPFAYYSGGPKVRIEKYKAAMLAAVLVGLEAQDD